MILKPSFHSLAQLLLAGSAVVAAQSSVILDDATVIGRPNGTVVQYLGLPFAQPPVGDLRLRPPQPLPPYPSGTINATTFGNQCLQQTFQAVLLPASVPAPATEYLSVFFAPQDIPFDEDCLNLNVIVPADAQPDSQLPVAVWIYGGGFQIGSNAVEPGEVVVARSIEIGHPVIFVSMNYRLSAFAFLGGKEVKEAGVANLGLHDQRLALRWIQKYISAFGGDPEKVMIWGESAGAGSVMLQMQANGGDPKGLFRAAFMESGGPLPTGYVDNALMQATYDQVVADSGCADAPDTLACLRTVPAEVLKAAMDKTPSFADYTQAHTPWFPRADGTFIPSPPQQAVVNGSPIAQIPFVIGNDFDEGTAFSFGSLNVTTDDEFLDYVQLNFPDLPRDALAKVLELYPSDPALGSPFNTGDAYAYSPQYKRMAAFEGDYILHASRRLLLQQVAEKQPVWSYLSNFHKVEGIGAAHGTELVDIFGGGPMGDYLIRFAATLDPNGDGAPEWPRYQSNTKLLLTFNDAEPALNLTEDTFREEGIAYLMKLSLEDPM